MTVKCKIVRNDTDFENQIPEARAYCRRGQSRDRELQGHGLVAVRTLLGPLRSLPPTLRPPTLHRTASIPFLFSVMDTPENPFPL